MGIWSCPFAKEFDRYSREIPYTPTMAWYDSTCLLIHLQIENP